MLRRDFEVGMITSHCVRGCKQRRSDYWMKKCNRGPRLEREATLAVVGGRRSRGCNGTTLAIQVKGDEGWSIGWWETEGMVMATGQSPASRLPVRAAPMEATPMSTLPAVGPAGKGTARGGGAH
ncbi:hypothetical protein GW17_00044504 [Ensete ventricosum]|nr:hypothetical protein GW17_00044504 [Ensete ventricosum]